MNDFHKAILKDNLFRISATLLVTFFAWCVVLNAVDAPHVHYQIWGALYQLTALFGAICGFTVAKKWGGFKSMMGRAILMFSFGLLCQSFAQTSGSFLVWQFGTVPYPSLSDVGAFGAVIFYAIGAIFLANASGAHVSLRSYKGKLIAAVIPLVVLGLSFAIFLRSYQLNWSEPLTTFLNIGYPLGEAFYLSMAILAYLLSRKVLGGIMRMPILFFIATLVSQYCADFLFLYNAQAGVPYSIGGINDLLFIISYSLMAISLIQLGVVYKWINES